MKIHIVADNTACSYHRILLPADTFPTADIELFIDHPQFLDKLGEADIVIFNRLISVPIEKIKEKGAKVVVDIDDYWHIPQEHPLYQQWYLRGTDLLLKDNLSKADMVWCTNQQLKQQVLPLNPNVHVIPNALPFGHDQFKPRNKKTKSKYVRFLWAGGFSHTEDIRLLESTFKEIGETPSLHNRSQFLLAGYQEDLEWQKMKQIFSKSGNYKVIPNQPMGKYMKVYSDADVSLIPLQDNTFCKHKSFLKVLEAAAYKLPCIVSNVLPYNELQSEGLFFVNSPEDWLSHIRYFIKNPEHAAYYGSRLHQYCKDKFDLKYWGEKRYELLKSL